MDKTVIGIDIDGTINEAHKWDIIHGRELCKSVNYNPVEKLDECNIKRMFNLSDGLYRLYMDKYFPWNVQCNTVRLGAAETIREWARQGHIIKIITARDPNHVSKYTGERMVEDTKKWFAEHKIPYHDIVFGCRDKAIACIQNEVQILIEDDPKHIMQVAGQPGILVLIAGQSYNEYLMGTPNTTWCADWLEIRDVVHELSTMY